MRSLQEIRHIAAIFAHCPHPIIAVGFYNMIIQRLPSTTPAEVYDGIADIMCVGLDDYRKRIKQFLCEIGLALPNDIFNV